MKVFQVLVAIVWVVCIFKATKAEFGEGKQAENAADFLMRLFDVDDNKTLDQSDLEALQKLADDAAWKGNVARLFRLVNENGNISGTKAVEFLQSLLEVVNRDNKMVFIVLFMKRNDDANTGTIKLPDWKNFRMRLPLGWKEAAEALYFRIADFMDHINCSAMTKNFDIKFLEQYIPLD